MRARCHLHGANRFCIFSHFLHKHEEKIIDVGPGRTGQKQVGGGAQVGIGIVAAEVVGGGEAGKLASRDRTAVGDAAGAVGWSVGAVGRQ